MHVYTDKCPPTICFCCSGWCVPHVYHTCMTCTDCCLCQAGCRLLQFQAQCTGLWRYRLAWTIRLSCIGDPPSQSKINACIAAFATTAVALLRLHCTGAAAVLQEALPLQVHTKAQGASQCISWRTAKLTPLLELVYADGCAYGLCAQMD